MPPKSKRIAATAGLVPGTLNQTQLDIIKNRPHLAAKSRRMADLRVRYSGATKALRPALKELAARTAQNLRDDDHYHLSGRNRQHYDRFKAPWDANLQEEIARINAITTMKMENEAAKTGYAQQEVGVAYGVSCPSCQGFTANNPNSAKLRGPEPTEW